MNIKSWLTKDEMKSIYSSDYWNEIKIEKDKIWNVNESDSINQKKDFFGAGGDVNGVKATTSTG